MNNSSEKRNFSTNWIISQNFDLTWFIGSVLAGYFIYFLYAGLGLNMIAVWLVWVICLDSPHFFATYSRTYFDREERRTRPQLLYRSLVVFLVGPVAALLSYILYRLGFYYYSAPWTLFLILVSLWAYWHITRQHYGFMKLYQRKNNESSEADLKLDNWLIYGVLIIPFLALLARHPSARGRIGLEKEAPSLPDLYTPTGSIPLDQWLTSMSWENWILVISASVTTGLICLFLWRQWRKYYSGVPVNLPKCLYLLAVIPLHTFLAFDPLMLETGLLTFTVIITIYHDLQYLAIVWFYNRNRYHKTEQQTVNYGLAKKITASLWIFMGIAIVANLPVWGYGCSIHRIPLDICKAIPHVEVVTFLRTDFAVIIFTCITSGFQMHHYLLDQFIWRPSQSRKLRTDLKLGQTL